MKIPIIIIITFLLAFLTSLALEIPIIKNEPARYWLVIVLMATEVIAGLVLVIGVVKSLTEGKE
jgi:energy-converting hydrogenase Eha subunit A